MNYRETFGYGCELSSGVAVVSPSFYIREVFDSRPDMAQLFGEFAKIDPADAVHDLIEAEVYLAMVSDERLVGNMPSRAREWLKRVGTEAVLFHDIGKAGVLPQVADSLAVTHDVSSEGKNIDNRRDWWRALHKIHPLVAMVMMRQLASPVVAEAIGSHHEFHVEEALFDYRGIRIASYPREAMRYGKGYFGYLMMMMKSADVVVALGCERSYRPWVYGDREIIHELENVTSDRTLHEVFGSQKLKPELVRGEFIRSAFDALGSVKERYPVLVRRGMVPLYVEGACDGKREHGGGMFEQLLSHAWQTHRAQFYDRAEQHLIDFEGMSG